MESIDRQIPFYGTSIPQNVGSDLFTKQISEYLNKNSIATIQQDLGQVQALMSSYRCAMLEVETKFRVLNEQFSLQHERNPIDSIKTRIKTPESILEKLKRKDLPITLNSIEQELNDVAGIKVICFFVDDIYMLAECLLQQDDIRLIKRKDYIKDPKLNGYRSLHLIVEIPIFLQNEKRLMKVEVQLRTIAMEFWANLEHKLRYKKSIPQETVLITSSELSECAEMSALLDRKMQKIRDLIENS